MAWHRAAAIADLPKDDMAIGLSIAGTPIALLRVDGAFFATHDICTHQLAHLSDGYLENGCIECPLHQARFDIRTGEVRDGPADQPVKTYAVRIVGGDLMIELEDSE